MKLTCRFYQKWLLPYAIGDLKRSDPMLAQRIASHLASCSDCTSQMQGMVEANARISGIAKQRKSMSSSGRLDEFESSFSIANRVVASIEPNDFRYNTSFAFSPAIAPFVGVAAFAMITLSLLDPLSGFRPAQIKQNTTPSKNIKSINTISGDGKNRKSDGSSVPIVSTDPFAPAVASSVGTAPVANNVAVINTAAPSFTTPLFKVKTVAQAAQQSRQYSNSTRFAAPNSAVSLPKNPETEGAALSLTNNVNQISMDASTAGTSPSANQPLTEDGYHESSIPSIEQQDEASKTVYVTGGKNWTLSTNASQNITPPSPPDVGNAAPH